MSIKIYADENVSAKVVEGLKALGVDVEYSVEVGHIQYPDYRHLEWAIDNERAILTHDKDFLILAKELTERGEKHFGIIYVHPKKATVGRCVRGIKLIVDVLEKEDMINHIEFI